MELYEMYASLGVSRAVLDYGEEILDGLQGRFAAIDRTAEYNQAKVLRAMHQNRVDDLLRRNDRLWLRRPWPR